MQQTEKSYAKLRNLTEPGEADLGPAFRRMGEFLQRSEVRARVQFRVQGEQEWRYWWLELSPEAPNRVHVGQTKNPDLEIVTRYETCWQMAEGSLSPLEAFMHGKMRARGNLELGQRLFRQLPTSEGDVALH
jgi:hypothetical protein